MRENIRTHLRRISENELVFELTIFNRGKDKIVRRLAHNQEIWRVRAPLPQPIFYGALVYQLVQRIVDPLGRVRLPYAPPILWKYDRVDNCAILER